MDQTDEFAASLLIVRQAARSLDRIKSLPKFIHPGRGCQDCLCISLSAKSPITQKDDHPVASLLLLRQ